MEKINMFAIGLDEYNLIQIFTELTYSGWEVTKIGYNLEPDMLPSIYSSYEMAQKLLDSIYKNKESIYFRNFDVIGSIIDKKKGIKFDPSNLKIFELVPTFIGGN